MEKTFDFSVTCNGIAKIVRKT